MKNRKVIQRNKFALSNDGLIEKLIREIEKPADQDNPGFPEPCFYKAPSSANE